MFDGMPLLNWLSPLFGVIGALVSGFFGFFGMFFGG